MDYDALLVLSFGGPEKPADVMPFLRNVTRGRGVPEERLTVVAEQYDRLGGRSPINDQCRDLIDRLREELARAGIEFPIYWGNRNWEPYVTDTVATMAADGVRRALVFVTSAFGSYSGCRQYREDLEAARAAVGSDAPQLEKLRLFYNHPGFLGPVAARAAAAMAAHGSPLEKQGSKGQQGSVERHALLFTAHSVPMSMARTSDYESQLRDAASLVADELGVTHWSLVFQSRSGPPQVPWLEPDICDHLEQVAGDTDRVTVVPLGFISDHSEVLFDLDVQAAEKAEALGIGFQRAATVGIDPTFVTMIRQLIEERLHARPRLYVGSAGAWPDECPRDHCPRPQRPSA